MKTDESEWQILNQRELAASRRDWVSCSTNRILSVKGFKGEDLRRTDRIEHHRKDHFVVAAAIYIINSSWLLISISYRRGNGIVDEKDVLLRTRNAKVNARDIPSIQLWNVARAIVGEILVADKTVGEDVGEIKEVTISGRNEELGSMRIRRLEANRLESVARISDVLVGLAVDKSIGC
jgi:hypothetical protein